MMLLGHHGSSQRVISTSYPIKSAPHKVCCLISAGGDMGAYTSNPDLITYVEYAPGALFNATLNGYDNAFDHSPAGIDLQATELYKFILSRRRANCLWWDPEGGSRCFNVPASVGYTVSDGPYAAIYSPGFRENLRKEAMRFQTALAVALRKKLVAGGLGSIYEFGHYYVPRMSGFGNTPGPAQMEIMRSECTDFLSNHFAFCAPSAYFSGKKSEIKSHTLNMYKDYVRTKFTRVRTYFPTVKVFATLWARFWISDGGDPWPNSNYPGNNIVVPAGWMRGIAETALECGVDGFVIWRASNDDDVAPDSAYVARHQEVVDVMREREDFRSVNYG